MGCVESSMTNDLNPNVFQVVMIQERGHRQRPSRLEVTDTHIIQSQKGRVEVQWPLSCLRRYGFDAKKFSFEAGRRCPTGPGIYYFKCNSAEQLFNLIQLKIQQVVSESTSRDLLSISNNNARENIGQEPQTPDNTTTDYHGYLQSISAPVGSNGISPSVLPINNASSANIPAHSPMRINCYREVPISPCDNISRFSLSPTVKSPIPSPLNFDIIDTSLETGYAQVVDRGPSTSPAHDSLREISPTETKEKNENCSKISRLSNYLPYNERPSSHSSSGSEKLPSSCSNFDRFQYLKPVPNDLGEEEEEKHLYINVNGDCRNDSGRFYANLVIEKEVATPILKTPKIHTTSESSWSTINTVSTPNKTISEESESSTPTTKINYIEVDLDRTFTFTQPAPPSPCTPLFYPIENSAVFVQKYAEIDFNKTEALKNTAKVAASSWENRETNRRNRKNSTNLFSPTTKASSVFTE